MAVRAAGGGGRRREKHFNCGGERACEGISRSAAGGTGRGLSGIWTGAAQRLLLGRTYGSAEAAGSDAVAPEELCAGGAADVRFFAHDGNPRGYGMKGRFALAIALLSLA